MRSITGDHRHSDPSLLNLTPLHSHTHPSTPQAIQYLSLCLFLLHLLRRLLETCCLMVYPPSARMHVIAYLFGLSYYLVAPLSLLTTTPQPPATPSMNSTDLRITSIHSLNPILDFRRLIELLGGLLVGGSSDWVSFVSSLGHRAHAAPLAFGGALTQASTVTEWLPRAQCMMVSERLNDYRLRLCLLLSLLSDSESAVGSWCKSKKGICAFYQS